MPVVRIMMFTGGAWKSLRSWVVPLPRPQCWVLLAILLLCHAAESAAGQGVDKISRMVPKRGRKSEGVAFRTVDFRGQLPDQCRTRAPLECGFVHIPLQSVLFGAGVLEVASFQGSCTDSCLEYLSESPSCNRLPELQQTMRKICDGYDCSNRVEAACGSTASGRLVDFNKACSQTCQEALDSNICQDIGTLLPAYDLYRERLGLGGSECRQHACHTGLMETCVGYNAERLSMPWTELCDEGCYATSTQEDCSQADVVLTGKDPTKPIATWAQFAQDPTLFGPESDGCRSLASGEPLPELYIPVVTNSSGPPEDSISNPEQAVRFDATFPDLALEDVLVDGSTEEFRAQVEAQIRDMLSLLGDFEVVNIVVGEPRAGSVIVPIQIEFAEGTLPEEVLTTLIEPANACSAAQAAFESPVLLEGLQGQGPNSAPSADVDCSESPGSPGFSVVDVGFDEEGENATAEEDELVPIAPVTSPPTTTPPRTDAVAVAETSRDGPRDGGTPSATSSGNTVVIIVGTVVGVLLLLAILVGVVLYFRRNRRRDGQHGGGPAGAESSGDVESKGQVHAEDGDAAEELISTSGQMTGGRCYAAVDSDEGQRPGGGSVGGKRSVDECGRKDGGAGDTAEEEDTQPFESDAHTMSPLDTTAEKLDAVIPKLDMSSLTSSPEKQQPRYTTPRNDSGTTTFRTAHETSAPTTYRTAGEGSEALTTWRTACDSFESCSEAGDGFETARSGSADAVNGANTPAPAVNPVPLPAYAPNMHQARSMSNVPPRIVKPYQPNLGSAPINPTPPPAASQTERHQSAPASFTAPLATSTFLGLSTKGWWGGSRPMDQSAPAAVEAPALAATKASMEGTHNDRQSAAEEEDSLFDADSAMDTTNFSDANSTFLNVLNTTTLGRSAGTTVPVDEVPSSTSMHGCTESATHAPVWGTTLGGTFSKSGSRRSSEESFRSARNTVDTQSVASSMYRTTGESFQSASEAGRGTYEGSMSSDVDVDDPRS